MRFRRWIGHKRLRAFGAPIYIHWTAFAVAGVLAVLSMSSPIHVAIAIASYFAIILIHECGHAWVARRRHHRVICIRISSFHGTCEHESADYEWDDVAIAWGGVLAQFAVAIPMLILAKLTTPQMLGPFELVITILGGANLVIALFNLMPAPHMDGAKAWRIIPLARDWWLARRTTKRALRRWTRR
jgi:Zn-dependent protease